MVSRNTKPNRRVLLVFPHDFTELDSGAKKYTFEIVNLLINQGFVVDQLALINLESKWVDKKHSQLGFIDRLYLYDYNSISQFNATIKSQKFIFYILLNIFRYGLKSVNTLKKIWISIKSTEVTQFIDYKMFSEFEEISSKYSHVFFSYIFWSSLLRNIHKGSQSILLHQDLVSVQWNQVGALKTLESEINAVNSFDHVAAISHDEMYLLRQFAPLPKYSYLPVFMNQNNSAIRAKDIDLIYVGYKNRHNEKALMWIISEICLVARQTKCRILIIGKIGELLTEEHKQLIEWIPFVENISEYYYRSKIAICPMLSGSGMKIKTIEALSYGLPVVTTEWGVLGMLNKRDNGCIVVDSMTDFSLEIIKLLSDNDYYRQTCVKSNDYFIKYHSIEYAKSTLLKIMNHLPASQM